MLPDPVTVAAAAPTPALSLAVISSDGLGSERVDTGGGGYSTVINHVKAKKAGNPDKHYVQILKRVTAVDPYSTLTKDVVASASLTINRPAFGFTDADMVALTKALFDFVYDTEVTPLKLLQFQS